MLIREILFSYLWRCKVASCSVMQHHLHPCRLCCWLTEHIPEYRMPRILASGNWLRQFDAKQDLQRDQSNPVSCRVLLSNMWQITLCHSSVKTMYECSTKAAHLLRILQILWIIVWRGTFVVFVVLVCLFSIKYNHCNFVQIEIVRCNFKITFMDFFTSGHEKWMGKWFRKYYFRKGLLLNWGFSKFDSPSFNHYLIYLIFAHFSSNILPINRIVKSYHQNINK